MHRKAVLLWAIILLSATQRLLAAGDSTGGKYPRAVLVQLSSEQNRVALFTRKKDYTHLNKLQTDAKMTREVTMNDFKDHFNYCPVYYFMDTNADAVKDKRFDRVLLNTDGTTVTTPVINRGSNDYVIVYYGYPNVAYRKSNTATDEGQSFPGRGLIIMNDEYKQIAYDVDPDYISLNRRSQKKYKQYSYVSKDFNIQYIPYAGALLPTLARREDRLSRLAGKNKLNKIDSIPPGRKDGSMFPDRGGTPTGVTPDYNASKRNTPKETNEK